MSLDALRHRARLTHEWGRILLSWPVLTPIVALAIVALACNCQRGWTLGLAPANALLVTFLTWKSRALARAARIGVVAGSAAFAVPLLACKLTHACALGTCDRLTGACIVGGAIAGTLIGAMAGAAPSPSARAIAAGGLVAMLMGALACSPAGLAGVAGLAIGLVVATVATTLLTSIAFGSAAGRK